VLLMALALMLDLGNRVTVEPLRGETWLVRSVSRFGSFGDVESNAVVVAGPREAVLIDTAATDEQTERVLEWAAARLKRPVRHLVVTHSHADCMGGIGATARRGIKTYALGKTIELSGKSGMTPVSSGQKLNLSGVELEVFFPGHGHTSDNLVVWLPRDRVLDGGCFVKAAAATNLGNTRESDLASWAKAVALVRERWPNPAVIVPGHGDPGGAELLEHTAELLKQR